MASESGDDKSQCIKEKIHPITEDSQELAISLGIPNKPDPYQFSENSENTSTKNLACLSNDQTSDKIESSSSNVQTTQINDSNIPESHNQDLVNNTDDQDLAATSSSHDKTIDHTSCEELTCEDSSNNSECESDDYVNTREYLIEVAAADCYGGDVDNPELYYDGDPEEDYYPYGYY